MSLTPFDELVHRVNNLLGTIEIQAELVTGAAGLEDWRAALAVITASARATASEVQRLRQVVRAAGGG
jgi:predicted secreted protein